MRTAVLFLVLVMCAVLSGCGREEAPSALAVEREVVRMASRDPLWPGYDPLAIPLGLFDGTDTYLFRHPAPPKDFVEKDGAYIFNGRHPAVVANTSANIGDVWTATLLLAPPLSETSAREIAAVALHEAFHVYQRTTERTWGADETHLFVYPVDHVDALTLRHAETEALRRVFATSDEKEMAAWAQSALDLRRERFDLIDDPFAVYERGIEAGEGTAMYVESKAAGRTEPEFPTEGFGPEDVRKRGYVTGHAFALLLDRFDADWRAGFADDSNRFLDTELAEALRTVQRAPGCEFSAAELSEFAKSAQADVETLLADFARRRTEFDSAPGWRLIVEADEGSPLWPKGFDPMNVRRVEDGLLHTRYIELGNEAGSVQVLGDTVMTQGLGPHPLFNGVKRLVLAGLESEPAVDIRGEDVEISLPAFTANLSGATVEKLDRRVYVRLGRQP
jgi:hypothetical protein